MKLIAPIIASCSIVAVTAGLRNSQSNSRDLGVVFDTEESTTPNNFKELRIIGGDDARRNEFGYTVSLEDDIGHFCGATLVERDIVISAAHCAGGRMWARVGAHDLKRNEGRRIKVKKEIVSDLYDARTTNYDFMILVLEEPAPEDVPLAKLHDPEDSLREDDSLTVIGWGNTNPGNGWTVPDVKQHVEVKYIPTGDCNSRNSYGGQITNAMLCAGERRGGEDACQGDSGGPLMRLGDGGRRDELVGVVSWGYGCASARHPGVYARITEVKEWIDQTIADESAFASDDSESGPSASAFSLPEATFAVEPSDTFSSSVNTPSNWREVINEDFIDDFGYNDMVKGGHHARQYFKAYGKEGIVRIQHGKGKTSSFSTNEISVGPGWGNKWRMTMTFQGRGMEEDEDRFCVQVKEDRRKWKDIHCYMSGDDFTNKEWIDEELNFTVKDSTNTLEFRWICEGDTRKDDVLFDKIVIENEIY